MQNTNREEAERLIGIAEKLLQNGDLNGTRDFAILAQETEPLLESSDQILAIADVLLAAENNPTNPNHHAILQIDPRNSQFQEIRTQYRRLALLLNPENNPFSSADRAFKLVCDAWAVLSANQSQLGQQDKLPVRRAQDDSRLGPESFWTACPYCYWMYEYSGVYEGCCLRCQNCERSFHGVSIPSLPPLVPGREAYYCSWGFFPMGFVFGALSSDGGNVVHGWVPPPPPYAAVMSDGPVNATVGVVASRKRGRSPKVV